MISYLAMIILVASSNYLVQFPINDWVTWGAIIYPMTFLVNELTNRKYGSTEARRVVYIGFFVAVLVSFWLAPARIAIASGIAFLVAQLLDIYVFSVWRQSTWWKGPFYASFVASIVDTVIFWGVAFWGEPIPLLTLALGDFGFKVLLDLLMLTPFRMMSRATA